MQCPLAVVITWLAGDSIICTTWYRVVQDAWCISRVKVYVKWVNSCRQNNRMMLASRRGVHVTLMGSGSICTNQLINSPSLGATTPENNQAYRWNRIRRKKETSTIINIIGVSIYNFFDQHDFFGRIPKMFSLHQKWFRHVARRTCIFSQPEGHALGWKGVPTTFSSFCGPVY